MRGENNTEAFAFYIQKPEIKTNKYTKINIFTSISFSEIVKWIILRREKTINN